MLVKKISFMKDFVYAECFRCKTPLNWRNDFMRSEVGLCDEDADEKDDSLVSVWQCPNCHTTYEIQYPSENELEEYAEIKENKKTQVQ